MRPFKKELQEKKDEETNERRADGAAEQRVVAGERAGEIWRWHERRERAGRRLVMEMRC